MTISDTRTRWLALIVLCLGDLMIVLDTTIVNVALPSIREDLGFSETSLAWVVNAYLLTFGGFLLLGGRLGDLFGHRRMFLGGVTLFTLASITCGLATSQGMLYVLSPDDSDRLGEATTPAGSVLGTLGREREQALVFLAARRAALEVRAQPRDGRLRVRSGELELDKAIELGEARVAADLRLGRAEEPAQDRLRIAWFHQVSLGSSSARPRSERDARSLRRASCSVL